MTSWVQEDDFNWGGGGHGGNPTTYYDVEMTNINNYDTMTWKKKCFHRSEVQKISPSFIINSLGIACKSTFSIYNYTHGRKCSFCSGRCNWNCESYVTNFA